MEFATLNNGIKMPMAGIGTFLMTPDEAEASVLSALESGCRLIDTANAYVNEKAVGRAMKRSAFPERKSSLRPSCGRAFMSRPTPLKRRSSALTPTTLICCSFISPQATISPDIS